MDLRITRIFVGQPGHGFRRIEGLRGFWGTAGSRILRDLRITRIFVERPGHGFLRD